MRSALVAVLTVTLAGNEKKKCELFGDAFGGVTCLVELLIAGRKVFALIEVGRPCHPLLRLVDRVREGMELARTVAGPFPA